MENDNLDEGEWVRFVEADSGDDYYHCFETGCTTWDRPKSFTDAPAADESTLDSNVTDNSSQKLHSEASVDAGDQSAEGNDENDTQSAEQSSDAKQDTDKATVDDALVESAWREIFDPMSGRVYYANPVSHESRWEKPASMATDLRPPHIPPPSPAMAAKPSAAHGMFPMTPWLMRPMDGIPTPFSLAPQNYESYTSVASFGNFGRASAGSESHWEKRNLPTDREGRQMSHYADPEDIQAQMEARARKRERPQKWAQSVDWKAYNQEKKMRKRKRALETLLNDE